MTFGDQRNHGKYEAWLKHQYPWLKRHLAKAEGVDTTLETLPDGVDPAVFLIKRGTEREWMSRHWDELPDGLHGLYTADQVRAMLVQGLAPLTEESVRAGYREISPSGQFNSHNKWQMWRDAVRWCQAAYGIRAAP